MHASERPKPEPSKGLLITALLSTIFLVYPESTAFASAELQVRTETALVFDASSKPNNTNAEPAKKLLTIEEVQAADYEYQRREILCQMVRKYLDGKGSPLSQYSCEIILEPQWQRALAISFVESNFGKRCAYNNCSGIGNHPRYKTWRKYPDKLAWFRDMSQLLEKPLYKQRYTNCNTMKGVYVKPGSRAWVNGCNKVSNELLAITDQAHHLALAKTHQVHIAAQEVQPLGQ